MPARFRVETSFRIKVRDMLVIVGDFVEGRACEGMFVSVPAGEEAALKARVRSLEFVQQTGGCKIGVTITMTDDQEVATWQASLREGQIITITDSDD